MKRITVVLHSPIYPRNIGMCARAMANMNISRLILVSPQTELTEEAKQGAAHAQAVLRESITYSSYAEYLENEGDGVRIALSGRDGKLNRPEGLDDSLARFAQEPDHPFNDSKVPIYLHFGTEDLGLSNEEMALCHFVCRLPTLGEITSLNLSHAVLLASYMVTKALLTSPTQVDQAGSIASSHSLLSSESSLNNQNTAEQPVKNSAVYYPSETIKRWLEALGFDLSARRVSIEKTLNRILLSRCPTNEELRVIDTVLQQTVRRLNEK